MVEQFDPAPPPRPRFGGPGPAILGLAGFAAALLVFGLVLILTDVLPSPISDETKAQPQGIATVVPSQLPKSARFAQQGECVLNRGTDTAPELIMVLCGPGELEVIERLEGTTDIQECRRFPDYRFHYFYNSDLGNSFDFVLCMRKRP